MAVLTQWESETRLVGLFVATGLLRGSQAQSLLLISPPGQGKTAMIERFSDVPSVSKITDLTSNGIRTVLKRDAAGAIRHFLMPEFARLYSRDQRVATQSVNLLCNLMTGDAGVEMIGQAEFDFTGRQLGVIAAMTTDSFSQLRPVMVETGLLSRFHVIPADRTNEERQRVIRNIAFSAFADLSPIRWPELRQTAHEVSCSSRMGGMLMDWIDSTSVAADERFMSRLMVLVRACALLNRRTHVTPDDVHTLATFTPYFEQRKHVQLTWPPEGVKRGAA